MNTEGSRGNSIPYATLNVRLPHESVSSYEASLVEPLPGQATSDVIILSQSTSAEDLTKTITDADRRQSQLEDYRDRLTALAKRSDAKVEDMVKIESELSNVQSQLESLAAEKKSLNERVDTESLSISFRSNGLESSAAPIMEAWHQGGKVLGDSAGKAISFTIGALPWLPIIAIGLFFVRFIWRRKRA